ncbi:metal ABC transporter ATP-binding protein [Actinacidiphila glaucinigra]|uniref:metal ABC transporter ATP-binding protein n=1 Tax=Actinacidiphila glaucinigra TaxID=235986 RepID=UPI00366FF1E5
MTRETPPSVPGPRAGDADVPGRPAPLIRMTNGGLRYGDRTLWNGLDLDVRPGEFWAVLGPNGSGKSSLVQALLGRRPLTFGTLRVLGADPRRAARHIGYIPQQGTAPAHDVVRARELVGYGLDGHRFGLRLGLRLGLRGRGAATRHRIDAVLEAVGASAYANAPLGTLSGGERQRVRIGQALATDPRVLLCDEPTLSLDLHHQRAVTELIDRRRRDHGTAVVFVTHEINPVLDLVDQVLYLAPHGHRIGPPEEVLTSRSLSALYGSRVDVLRVRGRIVVVGAHDQQPAHHAGPDAEHARETDGARP